MKIPTWSYSSISLFDQCPKKYYHLKVVKDIKEPESQAMLYGKDLHLAAEEFVRDGKGMPEKYAFMVPLLEKLKALPGEKYCEYQMGVKRSPAGYHMTNFFDPEAYYRGIADLLVINKKENEARLVDYKTGKSAQYADMKQLKLLAAATFVHFPYIKKIKAGLLFVIAKDFVTEEYEITKRDEYFSEFDPIVERLGVAIESGVWNPKRNFTCKNWCAVLNCVHNGRG
jgi:CRISPR/Cas system-associated exonuclease Cas4 (RecB family)